MRRAALLAILALAGCGGAPGPPPAPEPTRAPPTDEEQIGALLERRAERIGRDVRRLGVREARYEVSGLSVRQRSADVQARLTYRIAGVRGDFGSARELVLRRAGDGWRYERTLGDRDAEPWEVDGYRRERTEHFVIWAPRGVEAPAETLETGYARLGEVLDGLERGYLVVVARDGAHARRITRRIEGLESLAALTDTQVSVAGAAQRIDAVRSQRLIIVADSFAAIGPEDQEQVVTHELTHAVLAPTTSARAPAWLVEGAAMYLSGDDRRTEYFAASRVPTVAALSAPDAIGRLTGDAQAGGYATASAAAFFIADVHGEDALFDLLAEFNRSSLKGRAGDPRMTDRAMRDVLGVGLLEFQRTLG